MPNTEGMEGRVYCEDCQHFAASTEHTNHKSARQFAHCLKMPDGGYHMVGRGLGEFKYCGVMRLNKDACGPDAKWFEPKTQAQEAAE